MHVRMNTNRDTWHCSCEAQRAIFTANLRSKILDFRGFYISIILILRAGILMSVGNCLDFWSQAILVGIVLVGRLGLQAWILPRHPGDPWGAAQSETKYII